MEVGNPRANYASHDRAYFFILPFITDIPTGDSKHDDEYCI